MIEIMLRTNIVPINELVESINTLELVPPITLDIIDKIKQFFVYSQRSKDAIEAEVCLYILMLIIERSSMCL